MQGLTHGSSAEISMSDYLLAKACGLSPCTSGQTMLSLSLNSVTTYHKADDKIFVCKFSKNVKSKLYHIESSKTREQTM